MEVKNPGLTTNKKEKNKWNTVYVNELLPTTNLNNLLCVHKHVSSA